MIGALDTAIHFGLCSCFHAASEERKTRYHLTQSLRSGLAIETGGIVPCSIGDIDYQEKRPFNTSLNSTKFVQTIGRVFRPFDSVIDELKQARGQQQSGTTDRGDRGGFPIEQ